MEISAIKGGVGGVGADAFKMSIFFGGILPLASIIIGDRKNNFLLSLVGWFVCQFAIWSLGFLGDSFVIAEASMFAVLDGRAGLLDDCFQ